MDYKTENAVPQNDLKALQNVDSRVWAGAVLSGFAALGAIPVWFALLAFAVFSLFVWHRQRAAEIAEATARAAAYSNIIAPIVVMSTTPTESVFDVHRRADEWREALRLSGNPYADKIPIIEHPYTPMLYETWQLSVSWPLYLQECDGMRHQANVKWYENGCPAHLKSLFASQVLPAIHHAKTDA